ncbi:MAG: winged helix-turn-helix transcriptional regulator, partial [Thermoplasmata archaeon]|nr:winged helix-turn-helix transcriptional regulator [Thermoplasmata archaeon]
KALGLEVGVLTHHINKLEHEDYIRSRQDGMYRRFYPMDAKIDIRHVLSEVEEKILGWIRTNPGSSQKEIATSIGVSKKVVSYHIRALRKADFVRTEKSGRRSLCYASETGE